MFKLEDVSMGIWINEMKKEGFYVKYENDWWESSCALPGANVDHVPLDQIPENKATYFCSQTVNHNVCSSLLVKLVYGKF
ncbi:unnamed protein product [Triticum turgidum subsp. durum]|nr:unnamed protein product [Triticum turgidum subsp. durum]